MVIKKQDKKNDRKAAQKKIYEKGCAVLMRRQYPASGVEFIVLAHHDMVRAGYAYMTIDYGTGDPVPGFVIAQMTANSRKFAAIASDNEEKFETRRDYYPIERQIEEAKIKDLTSRKAARDFLTKGARAGIAADRNVKNAATHANVSEAHHE